MMHRVETVLPIISVIQELRKPKYVENACAILEDDIDLAPSLVLCDLPSLSLLIVFVV